MPSRPDGRVSVFTSFSPSSMKFSGEKPLEQKAKPFLSGLNQQNLILAFTITAWFRSQAFLHLSKDLLKNQDGIVRNGRSHLVVWAGPDRACGLAL